MKDGLLALAKDDDWLHTGGCNSFTHQSLLSAEIDPFRLDSQFEFSRTYSHQYQERAENVLEKREIVTSPFAYLEMLIVLERYQFDSVLYCPPE